MKERLYLFTIFFILILNVGCKFENRFVVEEESRKFRWKWVHYRVVSKVKLPPKSELPLWSDMTVVDAEALFFSEWIKVKGENWLTNNKIKGYKLFFKRSNYLSARTIADQADQIGTFLAQWLGRPFPSQITVFIVPEPESKRNKVKLPHFSDYQFAIFTDTDQKTTYSKYGLLGEFVKGSVRVLLTGGKVKENGDFWRTEVFPTYFELRGIGAMISLSYNRTATPKSREILRKNGRPFPKEVWRAIEDFRNKSLAGEILKEKVIRISLTFLAFIEDAYGRPVLASIFRSLSKNYKEKFPQAVERVIGRDWNFLWEQWKNYFYFRWWEEERMNGEL